MAYLRLYDYFRNIQSQQITEITGGSNAVRLSAELVALEEVNSYLIQKYLMSAEFTDTLVWSPDVTYKAKDRVYLDASAYSAAIAYPLKSLVLYSGNVYICITAITVPEAFTLAKWTLLGVQHDLFFVALPKPEFLLTESYLKNDQIFWNNKTYTSVHGSTPYGHSTALQYQNIGSLPPINVFPDSVDGAAAWGSGTAYAVLAGTLPTNAVWTSGDNRSQKIVDCVIDMALYKIHSRIAPNNIPQLRVDNYDSAVLWLKACSKGMVTANIPLIQPKQGRRTRFGGGIKNINSY